MAHRLVRDVAVAEKILGALERLQKRVPRHPDLRDRAARGTLKVNVATVCTEAGVGRHLLDDPEGPYADEHAQVAAAAGPRGSGKPLRAMLDEARAEKRDAEERLALAQGYALHLLARQMQLQKEVRRLEEEIKRLRGRDLEDGNVIERMASFPTKPRSPRGRRPSSGQH